MNIWPGVVSARRLRLTDLPKFHQNDNAWTYWCILHHDAILQLFCLFKLTKHILKKKIKLEVILATVEDEVVWNRFLFFDAEIEKVQSRRKYKSSWLEINYAKLSLWCSFHDYVSIWKFLLLLTIFQGINFIFTVQDTFTCMPICIIIWSNEFR